MSLIAEALRKTGTSLSSPPTPPSRPPRIQRRALGFLVLLMVLGGLLLVERPTPARQPAVPETNPLLLENLEPAPIVEPVDPTLLPKIQERWRLGGILRGGDGEALALINNQLLEKGGRIEGAMVTRIAKDEVDLEADGEVRTLRLR